LDVVEELHRSARKNFPRRSTIIKGYKDLFQMDLAEFIPYAKVNKNYRYILMMINCYSKYLWARPLKTKNGEEVTKVVSNIFKEEENSIPKNMQTDHGKEFYNSSFKKLMKEHEINHYSTFSNIKAGIIERAIRTIKNRLYKEFSLRGEYKWYDILQKVVSAYNHSKHRTIGMAPINVKPNTKLSVYDNLKIIGKSKLNVGDMVRISKYKGVFEKGFTPNWSTELFKIVKKQLTNPATFLIEDANSTPISGSFYDFELQRSKHPDVYLVEKILKKRGDQMLVKWLGINETSWVKKTDILA
ncbi:hypothetical protein ILUMI_07954, partial [Ignelater luminosus]